MHLPTVLAPAHLMKIHYPEALPVARHRDEIGRALIAHQVVIVCGDTGSGKTTQLPKIALEMLRGLAAGTGRKPRGRAGEKEKVLRVGCTQPRRLAATSVAQRVAEEMEVKLGSEVGYQIRFENRTTPGTRVKFMTDGILLAETQRDPMLRQYAVLIIDEAHERSLNIDFILGYLSRILKRRRDLKIIISSATLDAGTFSEFFGGAPVISVAGRTFPVTDTYLPPESSGEHLAAHVCRAAELLEKQDPLGDTLVFLPGEREIRECADLLKGRLGKRAQVLTLYARQAGNDQQAAFKPTPSRRRIILATNVAETSLTLPDIRSVIDSGIARVNRFQTSSGVQRLQIEKISKASARQRRGRCGRVAPGTCLRLYDDEDFEGRKEFTDPEILRTNLAGVVLQMEHFGLGDPTAFPFLDPPQPGRISQAYKTLEELRAMRRLKAAEREERMMSAVGGEASGAASGWSMTEIGATLARLPLDPRVGRILIAARAENCLREGIVIASALTIQNPKERPEDKQAQADQAHAQWQDPRSDFTSWLRLWHALDAARTKAKGSTNAVRKFAKGNFLNFRRLMEWMNLHREIRSVLKNLQWDLPDESRIFPDPEGSFDEGLHKAILTAIPSHIGMRQAKKGKGYKGARNREFFIHPASCLKNQSPEWVMAFEVVETARIFARNVASIDPQWFEKVCPHLVSYRHSAALWNPDQGAVYGEERVTAFGLVLEGGRPIHYGRLKPAEARKIFIWEALVAGNTKNPLPGMDQHRAMQEQVERLEQKLRRRGGLMFPEAMYGFYDERISPDVHTCKGFERWVHSNQDDFKLRLEDCVVPQTAGLAGLGEGFPDAVASPDGSRSFRVTYLHAIEEEERGADGLTVEIPLADLGHLPAWYGSWLVPGMVGEKAEAMLRTLHKDTRRLLPPLGEVVAGFLASWEGYLPEIGLADALANYLAEACGITAGLAVEFDAGRIPLFLQMRFEVVDDRGRALAWGRDLAALQDRLAERIKARIEEISRSNRWHRDGLIAWDFGDLPAETELDHRSTGYPALCATGFSCGLRVFLEKDLADWHHPRGLASLYHEWDPKGVRDLRKVLETPTGKAGPVGPLVGSASLAGSGGERGFSVAAAFSTDSVRGGVTANGGTRLLEAEDLLALKTLGHDPGRNFDDLVGLVIRWAFAGTEWSPRCADDFTAASEGMRRALLPAAVALCASLREILRIAVRVAALMERADAIFSDSIDDARFHLDGILRSGWLAEVEPSGLARIVVYLQGLELRIARMLGAPAAKDAAKMDRLWESLAGEGPEVLVDCPCGRAHLGVAELAYRERENELRLHFFAPELR